MSEIDPATRNPFTRVPIEITVSVGRATPMVRDLVSLTHDSVLPLDRGIADPVELHVGDRLIARGELQEVEGDTSRLAVRIVELVDLPTEP